MGLGGRRKGGGGGREGGRRGREGGERGREGGRRGREGEEGGEGRRRGREGGKEGEMRSKGTTKKWLHTFWFRLVISCRNSLLTEDLERDLRHGRQTDWLTTRITYSDTCASQEVAIQECSIWKEAFLTHLETMGRFCAMSFMTLSARSGLALIILWAAWKPRSVRSTKGRREEGEGLRRERG